MNATMQELKRTTKAIQAPGTPSPAASAENSAGAPPQVVRIGLIAPYTGTNLGDQAIQSACMANLKARLPGLEIVGIYLNTWRTAALHGVRTHPITGLLLDHYSNAEELFGPPPSTEPGTPPSPLKPSRSWLRNWLKALPGLRFTINKLRALAARIGYVVPEGPALLRAWRLVGELDLILVSGSGQIDDEWGRVWGQPYTFLRWAVLARLRRVPFAVASVGVSELKSSGSSRLFESALAMASYVSCRDPGSAAAMGRMLGGRDVPVVYDLAVGLDRIVDVPMRNDGDVEIVLSPMSFARKGTWPTEEQHVYDRYIATISEFVAAKADRNTRVTLVTSSGDDVFAITDLLERLRAASPASLDWISVVKAAKLEQLCCCLARATVVVASRLHGVILSHMLERPVVALSFDPKVDMQMQQYHQMSLLTSIRTFTLHGLHSLFDDALARRNEIRAQIRDIRKTHQHDVNRQYDALTALAKDHAGIA